MASWGGYSFIINLLPIHCLACVVTGRLTPKLYIAYAPFVVLGTLTAGEDPSSSRSGRLGYLQAVWHLFRLGHDKFKYLGSIVWCNPLASLTRSWLTWLCATTNVLQTHEGNVDKWSLKRNVGTGRSPFLCAQRAFRWWASTPC